MFYVPKPTDAVQEEEFIDGSVSMENNATPMETNKFRPACLNIKVIGGHNLASMDFGGKSDPYCIVTVGDEEDRTSIKYNTVNPKWGESFTFSIYNGPHFRSRNRNGPDSSEADHCIIHYVIVDVWDKDTLNRDDFMGRVMVPVSFLSQQPLCGWFSLGRTNVRDTSFTGEIYLELAIESPVPITRWSVDDKLHKCCEEIEDFEFSIQCLSDSAIVYPGETERVEMVFENVVIEVNKHRAVGTVYLTDYRLVIICKSSGRNSQGRSMWIAFKNIQSVDKAEGEKAVGKSLLGNRRTSAVKCLIIRCCDFKTIRLTFMDSSRTSQFFSNYTGNFKETLLLPEFNPKNGTLPSEKKGLPTGVLPRIEVLQAQDTVDDTADSWSLCEDDDVEEGEELTSEGLGQCRMSSHNVLKSSPSSFSLLDHFDGLSDEVKDDSTPGTACDQPAQNASNGRVETNHGMLNQIQSFVSEYVNILYERLTFLILNVAGSPPSKEFVKAFPQSRSYGWDVYDVEKEFRRQKVDNNWRLSEINAAYSTCPSYPRFLYVPAAVEDGILRKCAAFRSKGRLPVLCWFNRKKGNFIMRCAQPRTGARKKYSVDDEYVIQTALTLNSSTCGLVFFDARSAIAASGNQLKGKGTEDIDRYPGCKLTFLNIPNIHAVRDSLEKLQTACESSSQRKWFSQLEASQWLAYISLILKGAISIVRHVDEKGVSALIHCSDGWDRTSQLSALAQILLDPFYRTIKGFQVLIEKEWISFGHHFRDRNDHPSANSNQRSPIFLQFIDCVWQILIQFPMSFEFTSEYLLRIVDHLNSGWFGTFMCNNEKERGEEGRALHTVSMWAHLDNVQEKFRNESYVLKDEVLRPTSSLRRLRLWSDYYLRYDETFWSANYSFFDFGQNDETVKTAGEMVVWVANERVKECHDCKGKFTHFNRRHHCRACGQIFCNECSSHRIHLLNFGYQNEQRVCDRCYIKHKVDPERCEPGEATNDDLDSFEVV